MHESEDRSTGTGPRPEDDTPTDEMLRLARGGGMSFSAWIIPREEDVPAPDDFRDVKIAVIDSQDGGTPSYTFAIDGVGDPVMKEIATRYGKTRRSTMADKVAASAALFKEVCAAKRADGQAPLEYVPMTKISPDDDSARPGDVPARPQPQQPRTKPSVQLTFDFGPAGKMVGRYRDVFIQGGLLVLVADDADVEAGLYLPPDRGYSPDATISVIIPGLDVPVVVFSVDMVFQYGGKLFCMLLIDRDAGDAEIDN